MSNLLFVLIMVLFAFALGSFFGADIYKWALEDSLKNQGYKISDGMKIIKLDDNESENNENE